MTEAKKPFLLRPWVRAIHRDMGYLAVGLTLVYALSGLAVNHIADWDPNFRNYDRTVELGPLPDGTDDEQAAGVAAKLGIAGKPREVYRAGDELEVLYDHRSLHVIPKSGHVVDEGQKPRFFLRLANFLHLNRGKPAWRFIADGYALILLFLAGSGMLMIPGKRGVRGRGLGFVLAGILVPVLYVTLS